MITLTTYGGSILLRRYRLLQRIVLSLYPITRYIVYYGVIAAAGPNIQFVHNHRSNSEKKISMYLIILEERLSFK
jgi:hypothetical protein